MDEWPKGVLILCSVVIQSQLSSMLTMSVAWWSDPGRSLSYACQRSDYDCWVDLGW